MDSPLKPHVTDFDHETNQIMAAIAKAFTPAGDFDGLRDRIARLLRASSEKSIAQFHERAERIEKRLEALDAENKSDPADPPFRSLLKRYMQHVNDRTKSGPFVMVVSQSNAKLTSEEQGLLMVLERELILEMERKDRFERSERMEDKR